MSDELEPCPFCGASSSLPGDLWCECGHRINRQAARASIKAGVDHARWRAEVAKPGGLKRLAAELRADAILSGSWSQEQMARTLVALDWAGKVTS